MQIALIGYGKMGKAIEEVATAKGHSVVLKIDFDNPQDFTAKKLRDADVAIEFTHPDSAFENIKKCLEAGVPVVSGTTGWLERFNEIKKICEDVKGTFVYASNYSIGVNIFFEVNKRLAELMSRHKEYDVEMEEIHHTQKKDAPSGTAITLAEQILEKSPRKKEWINQETTDVSKLS
ncbi:MAG TPA: dihydrodipicolinate reductase C-terminal domain-containing protein, partial [Chitinophagaceae bacterium]|nr:dihydrodipicolinate reductase C-terminal domain-containing protein [Chitinophagaceae bacterium]